jgi:nucleotidyltransferase substrate binding protein (TIGR01987 family)
MAKIEMKELEKALSRLEEALKLPKNDVIRDSVIQRFEFTIELSWKTLSRYLKSQGLSGIESPKNAVREGARIGLIGDPETWIYLIDQRNLSSHTYKEILAEQVYAAAGRTPPLVHDLITKIRASEGGN